MIEGRYSNVQREEVGGVKLTWVRMAGRVGEEYLWHQGCAFQTGYGPAWGARLATLRSRRAGTGASPPPASCPFSSSTAQLPSGPSSSRDTHSCQTPVYTLRDRSLPTP